MKPNNSLRIPTARFEVTPPGGPPVTENGHWLEY